LFRTLDTRRALSIKMTMQPAPRSSIQPLGTNGDQRRRLFFHHVPLAVASAAILVAFMILPLFDAHAYPHGDIVSGTFPQPRGDGGSMSHDAEQTGGRQKAQTGPTDHGRDHSGPMGHEHRRIAVRIPAEARSRDHGAADARSGHHSGSGSEPGDDRGELALPRRIQQFTVATGYVGVGLLALTLLLGPANLLLRRRNPVSSYLRRDVGIWTAIFSVVHVIAALLMHVSHGSTVVASFLHFFVSEDGSPLTNSFGLGNWTGLAALVIVLGLLATSSDAALRVLKARPWKWLQRLTYALFVLVLLHALFYGALLRTTSPFTLLLVLSVIGVLLGQAAGLWLWRQRSSGIAL
jgi:sulfoxide reductase heme-binding subunit YedZ